MKLERVSDHIWSLRMWVLFPIRVWLVRDEDGITLVDAGISAMAGGILRAIDRLDEGPLQRVLLTHGHGDHVGAIKKIVQHTSVPVYAHPIEIPYMEGDVAYPRRKRAQASVQRGLVQPLAQQAEGGLRSVAGMKPYLASGHSPGHVVYFHEKDRVLLGGDLLMTRWGQLRKPMSIFTGDMAEALRSAKIVGELQPRRLEVAHAAPVSNPAEKLDAFLATVTEGSLNQSAPTGRRVWPTKQKRTL